MEHPLHKAIGGIFNGDILRGYEILKDQACGGDQNIPLFCARRKSNQAEYCNVDLLILKSDKIKLIIEIEEADVKPTQICGKFLTSALFNYYIHNSKNSDCYRMDDSVLFIQILDTSKLKKDKTSKIKQWKNIERSIRRIIPVESSKIDNYRIFYGDVSEFSVNGAKRKELIGCIRGFLSS